MDFTTTRVLEEGCPFFFLGLPFPQVALLLRFRQVVRSESLSLRTLLIQGSQRQGLSFKLPRLVLAATCQERFGFPYFELLCLIFEPCCTSL